MQVFDIAVWSVTGPVRNENQDCSRLLAEGHIVVLADGVSSRPLGREASSAAVKAVVSYLAQHAPSPDAVLALDPEDAMFHVRESFSRAHRIVREMGERRGEPLIATSLLVAVRLARDIVVGHVGECRCYRLGNASLHQLTYDHRMMPEGIEALSAADLAAVRPLACLLTKAIGDSRPPSADIVVISMDPEDTLLFCSNGMFDALARWQIARTLIDAPTAAEAASELCAEAIFAGAEDDLTAIVIRPTGGAVCVE